MLDVMRTGTIAGVGVGASRRETAARLGEPDFHSGARVWSRDSNIWRYADLELHFSVDREGSSLWMIWCDYIPLPMRPSARLRVDPWILTEPDQTQPRERPRKRRERRVSCSRLLTALEDAGVPYHLIENPRPLCDHKLEVRLASGARFGIGSREDEFPELEDAVEFIQVAAP